MRAEQLAGPGVEYGFYHSLGLAQGDRLAVADKREVPDFSLVAGVARRLLGQADTGDLRPAISAGRDIAQIQWVDVVDPGDLLDADHAFVARLVRQPGRADDIADRVHAGVAGAQPFVDDDMAALALAPGAFAADPLDIADNPDRQDDALDGHVERFSSALDMRGHAVALAIESFHRRAGVDLDPLLLEALAGKGGNLLVLDRQYPVKNLDDRDLGAHVAVEAGEFDPDRAGANDQQRARDRLRHHRLLVGPHELAVGFQPRQRTRARAGRQHDMRRGDVGDRLSVLRYR